MLKSKGVQVYECLVFDVDPQYIHIYLEEINLHHKLRIKDDQRIDSTVFFEEQVKLAATLKRV